MNFPHALGGHKISPLLIFGVVLAGAFVVYSYMSGGSGGGSTIVQGGTNANDAALQIAQMQGNFALAGAKLQADTASHVADLAAGVKKDENSTTLAAILASLQSDQIRGTQELAALHDNNQTQLSIAQLSAQLQGQQIAAQRETERQQLNLQDTIAARDQYDYLWTIRYQAEDATRDDANNATLVQTLLAKLTPPAAPSAP